MLGVLYKVLFMFVWWDIDLSKIELRLFKILLGEYFFLIDVFLEGKEMFVINVFDEIIFLGGMVNKFGIYYVYCL